MSTSSETPQPQVEEPKVSGRSNNVGRLSQKFAAAFNPAMLMGGPPPRIKKEEKQEENVHQKPPVVEEGRDEIVNESTEDDSKKIDQDKSVPVEHGEKHERLLHKKLDSYRKPCMPDRQKRNSMCDFDSAERERQSQVKSPAVL